MKGKWGENSISELARDEYLKFWETYSKQLYDFLKPGSYVAILMADWRDHKDSAKSIWISDYVKFFESTGFRIVEWIEFADGVRETLHREYPADLAEQMERSWDSQFQSFFSHPNLGNADHEEIVRFISGNDKKKAGSTVAPLWMLSHSSWTSANSENRVFAYNFLMLPRISLK